VADSATEPGFGAVSCDLDNIIAWTTVTAIATACTAAHVSYEKTVNDAYRLKQRMIDLVWSAADRSLSMGVVYGGPCHTFVHSLTFDL